MREMWMKEKTRKERREREEKWGVKEMEGKENGFFEEWKCSPFASLVLLRGKKKNMREKERDPEREGKKEW